MFNYEIGRETDHLAWCKDAKCMTFLWAVTLCCKITSLLVTISYGVLINKKSMSRPTQPCRAVIFTEKTEGCFAGNLTQCKQVDHCQSSCCYRRTTQSTELCVQCVNSTDSEVVPEHEWPLIQEVNLIFPSLNKQIKPKLCLLLILYFRCKSPDN